MDTDKIVYDRELCKDCKRFLYEVAALIFFKYSFIDLFPAENEGSESNYQ